MKKYLVTYEKYVEPKWSVFIDEVDIVAFCSLLEGVIKGTLTNLCIQIKPLRAAEEVSCEAAKTLLIFIKDEQDALMQKTSEEFFKNS